MEKLFHEEVFDKLYAFPPDLKTLEFEECTFKQIDWSNADLSKCVFIDCEFIDCNLSLSTINKTAFRNVYFKNCKLLGLHFENSNPFLFHLEFENCSLDLSCFFQCKNEDSRFLNCSLKEVDFEEAELQGSSFIGCNLEQAVFNRTNLENCNFHKSYNLQMDPSANHIASASFDETQLIGLLSKYKIKINK